MSKPASRSARIFCSSRALHRMNSRTSGCSTSRITIFAARRVLPPLLIVPADASAPRMKLTGPEGVPPPARRSFDERMRERLTPAPEPPLKITPSSRYQSRIELIESSTLRMKHAELWLGTPSTPMLNHTGLLKAMRCSRSRVQSSARNVSRSSASAKYPSSSPHPVMVSTMRSIS